MPGEVSGGVEAFRAHPAMRTDVERFGKQGGIQPACDPAASPREREQLRGDGPDRMQAMRSIEEDQVRSTRWDRWPGHGFYALMLARGCESWRPQRRGARAIQPGRLKVGIASMRWWGQTGGICQRSVYGLNVPRG